MNKQQSDDIVNRTYSVFSQTTEQLEKFKQLPKIDKTNYDILHYKFLVPTDITIDCDLFHNQITQYDNDFAQWGTLHKELPRYGLALVNTDGKLTKNDPINGSLYQYNLDKPNDPLFETDCTVHTQVFELSSLDLLHVFDGYYTRSNILKWNKTAKFLPHIDSFIPSPWIRLWATTNKDTVTVHYYDKNTDSFTSCDDIESGRVYVIDTSIVHDAVCTGDVNYQLFLSINSLAYDIISKHILPNK